MSTLRYYRNTTLLTRLQHGQASRVPESRDILIVPVKLLSNLIYQIDSRCNT